MQPPRSAYQPAACLRAQSQLKSHLQINVCSLFECESQLCRHASPSYIGVYMSYHELACDVRRMEVAPPHYVTTRRHLTSNTEFHV